MPYKVELNRFAKRARLVYYGTPSGTVAPRKTARQADRRVIKLNGRLYHVTKGWRGEAV